MIRILVTGGAGFIGSNVVAHLIELGYTVDIEDDFSSGSWRNIVKENALLVFDPDYEIYDVIVHLASTTDTSQDNQKMIIKNNVSHFQKVIDYKKGLKKFYYHPLVIYASSASVYGKRLLDSPAMKENDDLNPDTTYAFTKFHMEKLAEDEGRRYKGKVVGLRFFNVFGKNERGKGKSASMITQIYDQIEENGIVKLFKGGRQMRDFVHVNDVSYLITSIIFEHLKDKKKKFQPIYNVGSGESISFNDLVKLIGKGRKFEPVIEYKNSIVPWFQDFTKADINKAKEDFNWSPQFTLEERILKYIDSLKGQRVKNILNVT
jgi:ADP-L-glycero-D-manno-heptose 6-epimerase